MLLLRANTIVQYNKSGDHRNIRLAPSSIMDTPRQQLSDFLKSCRARVSPGELGLPDGSRRRTPGLRREDVAAVAGVSVTWYTWLEQGRDIRVSARVLEKVSSALRLSGDERDFLFSLVQSRPAPPLPTEGVEVDQTLKRMIDSLGVPTIVLNERWDVLAWNALSSAAFRDYGKIAPEDRNLLRILLLRSNDTLTPEDYDAMAHRVIPKFRVDYSQSGDPESFNPLIEELSEACPTFKRLWSTPKIATKSVGMNRIRHPELGVMTFEHSSYVPEGSPTLRIMIFVPADDQTDTRLRELRQRN
jgi:transcriptional regulator with XRE-family HTH domain